MPRNVRTAALGALGFALALPVVMALAYYVEPLKLADAHVLAWFSSFEYTTPTSYVYTTAGNAAKAITFFAEPVPMLLIVGLAAVLALRSRRLADAIAALTVVAGANLTTQVLKHLLAHDRYQSFLAHPPNQATFPSGHVTAAAAMVVALVWLAPPARRRLVAWAGGAYIVLVGLSVLVLEWHFPSDILGALCVVGAWSCAVLAVYLHLVPPRGPRRRSSEAPPPYAAARAPARSPTRSTISPMIRLTSKSFGV
ncbi:MAG: phosphatase PAP2 family protein [Actinobacteria bacterium]|nr:phosphatase PAP2 family protein [Actinomycetota bacterium]